MCASSGMPASRFQRRVTFKGILQPRTKGTRRIFPVQSDLRKTNLKKLKSQLATQQYIFTEPNTRSEAVTIASYRVCHVLAKNKKSFQDGEMVEQAFIKAADLLFGNLKKKDEIMSAIKDLQL